MTYQHYERVVPLPAIWPQPQGRHFSRSSSMKFPARDHWDEYMDDDSDQHDWYSRNWGECAMTPWVTRVREEFMPPDLDADIFDDQDEDNSPRREPARQAQLETAWKRAARNCQKFAEARKRVAEFSFPNERMSNEAYEL